MSGNAAARRSGEHETVLCLDGIHALLKRSSGGTNKPLLRAGASRPGLQIIGVLPKWEFNDLIGGDAEMLDLFTRIEIDEPNEEVALEIVKSVAAQMAAAFRLEIPESVVERAIELSSSFVLNESHPAKAIKIVRHICEDLDFDRTQLGLERNRIEVADVLRTISGTTSIPVATLSGDTAGSDYEAALSESVVGQDRAIAAVANELRLIKAGLTESEKPASVLLFAGMTGVGKTELAKRLAELYSASRRMQTYAMGNFTEPHSVSGIIGVPPGYVGHDEGGRLVNEQAFRCVRRRFGILRARGAFDRAFSIGGGIVVCAQQNQQ